MTVRDTPISRVALFASLPPDALLALGATLEEASYASGTVLFYEGEQGDRFYIVQEGSIEIIKAFGTPDERLLSVRGAGEFVGEMSLLNRDGQRTATVRAQVDTRMLELTRANFDALLHQHPGMAYEMLQVQSTRLREAHEVSMRDLQEKNRQLTKAYYDLQAAQAQVIEQQTLLRELQVAREIQESMLPPDLAQLAGFDIGARMVPARTVGGDFFDVVPFGPDALAIAIGDVSGKGVPAALFMALVSNLLRAEATRGVLPEEALLNLNRHLLARNAKGMFVTLLFGVLRRASREFRYVRAGHEFPLGWDARGTRLDLGRARALPLGIFADPVLDAQTVTLPPGGTLLLFTDGAVESMDAQGNLFGHERLYESARAHPGCAAQELCERLVQVIAEHHGAAPQFDDITLVVLRALPA